MPRSSLVHAGANLKATVLKVGHHGSRTSLSYSFLQNVSPRYAVVSCGKDNSYGHPHEQTLNRLEKIGAEVYRTDVDHSIVFRSNGTDLSISTVSKIEE